MKARSSKLSKDTKASIETQPARPRETERLMIHKHQVYTGMDTLHPKSGKMSASFKNLFADMTKSMDCPADRNHNHHDFEMIDHVDSETRNQQITSIPH